MEDLPEDREEIDDAITEFYSLAMHFESVSTTVRMSLDRGGHAVVVDGVTVRNGQQVVAIRDPALGRQYFTPIEEFREKFSGEVIYTRK